MVQEVFLDKMINLKLVNFFAKVQCHNNEIEKVIGMHYAWAVNSGKRMECKQMAHRYLGSRHMSI